MSLAAPEDSLRQPWPSLLLLSLPSVSPKRSANSPGCRGIPGPWLVRGKQQVPKSWVNLNCCPAVLPSSHHQLFSPQVSVFLAGKISFHFGDGCVYYWLNILGEWMTRCCPTPLSAPAGISSPLMNLPTRPLLNSVVTKWPLLFPSKWLFPSKKHRAYLSCLNLFFSSLQGLCQTTHPTPSQV